MIARQSRRIWFALLVLILSLGQANAAGRAVVFVTGNVGARDVIGADLTAYDRLTGLGAVGLMNTRTGGLSRASGEYPVSAFGMESACATIGAGTRVRASSQSSRAYNADETVAGLPAASRYELLTLDPPGEARVVHLGIRSVANENLAMRYSVAIGGLGDALHRRGLVTAALGNSDLPGQVHREASLICAGSSGLVDLGDVGRKMSRREISAPFGLALDVKRLVQQFDSIAGSADLIVVDAGDTSRADAYAAECTTEQAARQRRWAIEQADYLLGEIIERLDLSTDLLIAVSPNPPRIASATGEVLTPVFIAGPNFGPGLLTSSSTRRAGIVTNTDITATLLRHFGLQPWDGMVGRPAQFVPSADPPGDVLGLNQRLSMQARALVSMRHIAVGLLILVAVVTLAAAAARNSAARNRAAVLALIPAAVFLAVLWLPGAYHMGTTWAIVAVVALAAGLATVAILAARSPARAFVWLSSIFAASVAVDLLRGGVLLRESLLSYAPSEGARYYGIGNELMGAFIGASIVAVAAGLGSRKYRKVVLLALSVVSLCAMIVLIGAPAMGANAGGAMAAACGAMVTLLVLAGRRIRVFDAAAAGLGAAAVAGVLLFADSLYGAGQSHVGRAGQMLFDGGWLEFWNILERKLAMNTMLLSTSIWSRLLFLSVCACVVVILLPAVRERRGLKRGIGISAAVAGVAAGTVGALVLNDSGVVAAATCILYLWAMLLVAPAASGEG